MPNVTDILDRHKSLNTKKDQWRTLWQEMADLFLPHRGGFTTAFIPGSEISYEIYDSTPMQARRGLATAIDGLMKPSTEKWFWLRALDDDLNEVDEAKFWFDIVRDRMWTTIYQPSAQFREQSSIVDNDLPTFGLGHLWCGDNRLRNGLSFRGLWIGDVAIDSNADGLIDTWFISRKFTARQAKQRFGDKTPPKIEECLKGGEQNKDKLFDFVQAIYPRSDRNPAKKDSGNLPFANCIVSISDQTLVEESGFHEAPISSPRWEVIAQEVYPRAPSMLAAADARTLQAMGHTLLVAGERAADPAFWYADDGLALVRTFPGGGTAVNTEILRELGGKPPIGVIETSGSVPIGQEMQQDYREMVGAAFYKNVFNLPVIDRQMTATEILERKEEFLRTIGPALGQLESGYIGPIVERVFGLMMRAKAFPPPPDVLQGADVRFEFQSPVQQAKRQTEVAGLARSLEILTPMIERAPEMMDNFDTDEIAQDLPEIFGMRHKWMRPVAKRDEIRAERQQVAAGAGALAEGQAVADIADTAGSAANQIEQAKLMAQQMPPPGPEGPPEGMVPEQMPGGPGGAFPA